jgi:hypothetical protein
MYPRPETMLESLAGLGYRSLSSPALDGYDYSQNTVCGWIIFLPGVAASDHAGSRWKHGTNAVHAKSVLSKRQSDTAATQVLARSGGNHHGILIQDIRLHTLSLRPEAHLRATIQERLANSSELPRIPLYDGVTLRHGRWPPRRIHRGQI